jgi:hypothetical protein
MANGGQSKRFFSGKMALIALGVTLLGVAVGGYCVMRVMNEGRISLGGFLLAGVLVLAGLALVTQAFPKGCAACAQPFVTGQAVFAPALYEQLLACVQQQNAAGLGSFVSAPSPAHGDKTTLVLNYCPKCRQLGEADVREEQWTGQYDKVVRSVQGVALTDPMLAATLGLLERRGGLG